MLKCEIVKKGVSITPTKCVKVSIACVCEVGEAEKSVGTRNVDTINSTRFVGTVSLMLFQRLER